MMYGGFAVLAAFAARSIYCAIEDLYRDSGYDVDAAKILGGLAGLTVFGVAAAAFVTNAEVVAAHMIASAVAAGVTAFVAYNV
jgi:hypothetical protein